MENPIYNYNSLKNMLIKRRNEQKKKPRLRINIIIVINIKKTNQLYWGAQRIFWIENILKEDKGALLVQRKPCN